MKGVIFTHLSFFQINPEKLSTLKIRQDSNIFANIGRHAHDYFFLVNYIIKPNNKKRSFVLKYMPRNFQ